MRILALLLLIALFLDSYVDAKGIRMKLRRKPHPKKGGTVKPKNGSLVMNDVYGARMGASEYNVIYEALISLGTPPKTFSVIMDTGSTELWVPHVNCVNEGALNVRCPNNQVYNEDESDSEKLTGEPFVIRYGIGETRGVYIEDYFAFGDAKCEKNMMKLKEKIRFGAGDHMVDGDRGIMGLAYGGYGEKGTVIFEQAVKEGLMTEPVFTILYKKCPPFEQECKNAGMITFGEHDKKLCGDIIGYAPVNQGAIHWEFMLDSLEVGNFKHKVPTKVITDTGASHMFLDQATHDSIVQAMGGTPLKPGSRSYVVPCNKQGIDIKLTIGGIPYTIPLDAITLQVSQDQCQIMVGVTNSGHWNLGDPWVRSYCHIHDWKQKRIGFAKPL
ncbi:Eukaryotic aspartyl protease [Aphelenchoides bicaudatus]|nr:Eukaryotic aspartyl protease [Aphelenchoides bicaudatus]